MKFWKQILIGNIKYQYIVSNHGDVLSIKTGKILKPWIRGSNGGSYLCVGLSNKGKVKKIDIQRIVAKAFIPNQKDKPEVNHKNKNRFDNRVCNLEWVTRSENERHKLN